MRTRARTLLVLLAASPGLLGWLGILSLPETALAGEEAPRDAVDFVRDLALRVNDPDATWQQRWRAYEDAKEALEEAEGETKERAEEAYDSIRPQVAEALRRERLEPSGWVMGFIGAVILWGGFAAHVGIARRRGRQKKS